MTKHVSERLLAGTWLVLYYDNHELCNSCFIINSFQSRFWTNPILQIPFKQSTETSLPQCVFTVFLHRGNNLKHNHTCTSEFPGPTFCSGPRKYRFEKTEHSARTSYFQHRHQNKEWTLIFILHSSTEQLFVSNYAPKFLHLTSYYQKALQTAGKSFKYYFLKSAFSTKDLQDIAGLCSGHKTDVFGSCQVFLEPLKTHTSLNHWWFSLISLCPKPISSTQILFHAKKIYWSFWLKLFIFLFFSR